MKSRFFQLLIPSFLAFGLLLSGCQHPETYKEQLLHEGWQLINPLNGDIYAAMVPGNVHTDLMAAGIIPDPFFRTNEDSVQWVAGQKWVYETTFDLDADFKNNEGLSLVFEGLDTYAQVYLNDSLLLEADNMFRRWEVDIMQQVQRGSNSLRIVFHPADSINLLKRAMTSFELPEERARTRKAPYQFGWDWGPTLPTMGIWKSVKLVGWRNAFITDYTIHQMKVDSLSAELVLELNIQSPRERAYRVQLMHKGRKYIDQMVQLSVGETMHRIPFRIKNPERWWPNGMGAQNLYEFDIKLLDGNKQIDSEKLVTGLRKIELITAPDSIGETFYFRVNDKPVFMKGVNYIPEDNFLNGTSREKTRKLLQDAAAVHMNMIRVWGGGIYPEDYFFEIADSLGLLVWQDFMFACTMYPFDEAFMDNVKQEATEQIRRIRKHPSVAIWCGNNEVDEGFHNWGWQQSLGWTNDEEAAIWQGYKDLFEDLLPTLVGELDPARPYWPSSPSTGWGRPESLLKGDVHYWGVWWGEETFDMYEKKVGRFHSEYGFQAMPAVASIRQFTIEDDRHIGSEVLESHQKHPRGTRLIDDYMRRYFPVPDRFEDYVYMSQMVQSFGIVKAIEAHRRAMPVCMGTLYWQLNDCWPVTSWSSIDYYGRWKALHYHLKQAYDPLMISFSKEGKNLRVHLLNENLSTFDARLDTDLVAFDGTILLGHSEPEQVVKGKPFIAKTFNLNELLKGVDPSSCMLRVRLTQGANVLSEKHYFFVYPKDLKLSKAVIKTRQISTAGYVEIEISSDVFVKGLMLESNDADGFFADNFFDLYPGVKRVVAFYNSGEVPVDQLTFEYTSLNQFVAN